MNPLVKFSVVILIFTLCVGGGCGEVVTVCKQYNPATDILPECEGETVIMVKSNQQTGEESLDECAKEKIREIVRKVVDEKTSKYTTTINSLLETMQDQTTTFSTLQTSDETTVTFLEKTSKYTTTINSSLETMQDQTTTFSTLQTSDETTVTSTTPKNCDDVARQGHVKSGTFYILLNGSLVEVYCELNNDSGNWLVFQNRFSGKVDFYLNWTYYQTGFGNKSGEFWLGLEYLHIITSSSPQRLRVELEDWNGTTAYAEYSSFSIGNSSTNYRLNVDGYNGTAGDAMLYHNNVPFSTKDRDNSPSGPFNCAGTQRGAWWYKKCSRSNLNGLYVIGGVGSNLKVISWRPWRGVSYSMKEAKMKLQPS